MNLASIRKQLYQYKYEAIYRGWLRPTTRNEKSVYFYTFHKCASSLFSKFLLTEVPELYHIDYAKYLWKKSRSFDSNLTFRNTGYLYGPIRLSATNETVPQVKKLLVDPTSSIQFVKDKKTIAFVRDPRDILVSSFYSYGFTHALNSHEEKRKDMLALREKIQNTTIDNYVIDYAEQQLSFFNTIIDIHLNSEEGILVKYEDLVDNFDKFIHQLRTILPISDKGALKLKSDSRPKNEVDENSHRRSGKPGRYKQELRQSTILELNSILEPVLKRLDYHIS